MKKVLILRGLIASGKSTFARDLVDKGGWKRTNKDSIRDMVDNSKWSRINEKMVEEIRDFIILKSLENGFNVIVDDTNFSERHINHIKELVRGKAKVEIKDFIADIEECIKRDLKRPNSVGEKVIRQMYNQFVRKTEKYNGKGLPKACIVDVDGTLTIMEGRGAFEWSKVGQDLPNKPVINIVNMYADSYKIIVLSGRDSVCRKETEDWLERHKVKYDVLYMRAEGDMRKDTIIKKELFDAYVRDKFCIETVFDDRNCVVSQWRDMGLNCFQVNEGDF
jgi:predicted kinase